MEVMSSGCCRGSERRWHCDGQTGLESRRVFVRVTAHLRIHQDANGCVREGEGLHSRSAEREVQVFLGRSKIHTGFHRA